MLGNTMNIAVEYYGKCNALLFLHECEHVLFQVLFFETSQVDSVETYVSNGFHGNLRPSRVPWKPMSQIGSVETYVPNKFCGNLRP